MGSDENTFDVIFDTGSANFWIDSKKCDDIGCKNHHQYNAKNSKNFKKLGFGLEVEFGTGGLTGEINEDTVFLGGISIEDQDFAEIVKEDGDVFAEVTYNYNYNLNNILINFYIF